MIEVIISLALSFLMFLLVMLVIIPITVAAIESDLYCRIIDYWKEKLSGGDQQ